MNLLARLRFAMGIGAMVGIAAQAAVAQCADTPLRPVAGQQFSHADGMVLKSESFDRDPSWLGVNNRLAKTREPLKIRQDFGFSPLTAHAAGRTPGEIGGFVTPAGEAAFYGQTVAPAGLNRPLSATGKMTVGQGGTNLLLGFFNSRTVNEWRTPNTIAIRLNGRGETFFSYVEYCTSKWRAGGDTTPFPSITDPQTGRWNLIGYPCDQSVQWTLTYDPRANDAQGAITATIGNDTAVCKLDVGHKDDGASFDRFGILNVMKSADSGSEVWIDDVAIRYCTGRAEERRTAKSASFRPFIPMEKATTGVWNTIPRAPQERARSSSPSMGKLARLIFTMVTKPPARRLTASAL